MAIRRNQVDRDSFIEQMASLLEPWGMARSMGRVYAYLLLRTEPSDIEQIAADLDLSRSATWSAARSLEGFGHIRRHTTPGTKRARYAQSNDYGAPLGEQFKLLSNMALLLTAVRGAVADPKAAQTITRRAKFYREMEAVIRDGIQKHRTPGD